MLEKGQESPLPNTKARPMHIQLLSVNLGKLQPIPWAKSKSPTGIFKLPTNEPVQVHHHGLEGDHIGSVKYHGGPDQAVYIYSASDYAWWEEQLQRPLPPGIFGENLTVSNWPAYPLRIGDHWQIGELLLEISAPRIPCSTLASRLQEPTFVKRFAQANRGGAYARVLQPGTIQAGQTVETTPTDQDYPLIDDVFALWHQRKKDPEKLREALASPIASRMREDLEKWLARLA